MSGSIWERFPHDPRHPEHAPLRASDRDRDVVNDVLGAAYADGRLTPEELDERGDQVAQAKTLGELPPIIRDLVASSGATVPVVLDRRAEAESRYRQQRQQALWSFLTPTLICWVIYLATMAGRIPVAGIRDDRDRHALRPPGHHPRGQASSRSSATWRKERKKLEKQRRMRKWLPAPTGEQQDSPDDPRANQG